MTSFTTTNRHGYNVQFSPFNPYYVAVVSNENFGMIGKGTLFILNINSYGTIQEINNRHWPNTLYDVAWSETDLNHILTASGDSSIQLWKLSTHEAPIKTFLGHSNEVTCIEWSRNELILSGSLDTSIKLWDPCRSTCLNTFLGSSSTVYEATLSPHLPNLFASVSGDGNMKLWNTLNPNPVASFRAHDNDVLSCDWCKHDRNLIATCGSDSLIRGWDIRNYRQPVFQLKGSDKAVKRIRFSPHYFNVLASCSFDCTTKVWDFRQNKPLEVFDHHSEFVYGIDWNFHNIGEIADCSWDSLVTVFTSRTIKNLKNKI